MKRDGKMGRPSELEHQIRGPVINNRLSGKRKCSKQRKEITKKKKMVQETVSELKDMNLQVNRLMNTNTMDGRRSPPGLQSLSNIYALMDNLATQYQSRYFFQNPDLSAP